MILWISASRSYLQRGWELCDVALTPDKYYPAFTSQNTKYLAVYPMWVIWQKSPNRELHGYSLWVHMLFLFQTIVIMVTLVSECS